MHPLPPIQLTPLPVNLDTAIPFIRSVAYSIVAQKTTRAVWADDEGSIKYLYAAFCGIFGTPGTVQIQSAEDARMREMVEVETLHRISVLLTKAEHGPASVTKYLKDQAELREFCLRAVQEQYALATAINRDIGRAWGRSIEFLANIELGATLVVKGAGLIPGPYMLVSLGYDVVLGTVDDMYHPEQANCVVVIATANAATEGGKDLAGRAAEWGVGKLNGQPTAKELQHAFNHMRTAEAKLARQTEALAMRRAGHAPGMNSKQVQDSIRSLSKQIPRNANHVDKTQKAFVKSAVKRGAAKAVGWMFFANDVFKAIEKRNTTVAAARQ